jgi:hypothetical protein
MPLLAQQEKRQRSLGRASLSCPGRQWNEQTAAGRPDSDREQMRAARGLIRWSAQGLARETALSVTTIRRPEPWMMPSSVAAIRRTTGMPNPARDVLDHLRGSGCQIGGVSPLERSSLALTIDMIAVS